MLSQELVDWLRLVLTPEIGSRRGKSLLERFKTPNAILEAPLEEIAQVENIGLSIARKIVEGRRKVDLARQIKLIEKNNVTLIPLDSEFYPVNLKSIYDPPLVLFVKGEILSQDYFSIAIVGTRLSSFYGRTMSEKISRELVEKGFTIVSGGARGIDTFSHQTALRTKGRTLAVLGCGLDTAYPFENKKLFEEITEHGALISEFPLSTRPDKGNFPMRNRIISGLSLGVVVVEAPHKSGALITVTHANEQGREVFSVPGHADSFVSRGTNQLLREGAKLVENADDIIEELEPILRNKINEFRTEESDSSLRPSGFAQNDKVTPWALPQGQNDKLTQWALPQGQNDKKENLSNEKENKLYELITCQAIPLDELIEKSNLDVSQVSTILLSLQIRKLIKQLPGKQFVRNA
ncbi:MAG: DNA-processing protein DprA [Candidatus Omnitrophota bacterium]|nr:DNA-processing protein DprA [Candidatus Omnitrophota bacterium]